MTAKKNGRVALVTGAGRGIGRAIAEAFGAEGMRVVVTARSEDQLAEVVASIREAGGEATSMQTDLSDPEAAKQVIGKVKREVGPVEILVNNAGVGSSENPMPVVDFDDDFWHLSMAVNLHAPYILSKMALPDMLAAKWGRIIIVASINSKVPALHGAAYAASKHGVLGLMKVIAMETAGTGVTANAICPGPVRTAMNDARIVYDAKRRGVELSDIEETATPMGRRLEPAEMAPMAVYLASEGSSCVTGQGFNVDGGLLMTG